MPRIFISYRREDSGEASGRLGDGLKACLGKGNVFMDVDNIPVGVDFRQHLEQAVSRCDVLLAVIGEGWLEARYAEGPRRGQRRLDDPEDFVRIEIKSALARKVRVVPVLVRGAAMPRAEDLPDDLRPLAFRQAAEVRPGRDFRDHLERLIRDLAGPGLVWRRRLALAAGVLALAALVVLLVLLLRPGQPAGEAGGQSGSFEGSTVERAGAALPLDSALPLFSKDGLHLTCALPPKMVPALFWLDSEGKLTEMTTAEVAAGRLHYPAQGNVVSITGPPGTEFLLIAGGPQGPPSLEEVQQFLGSGKLPPLPEGVKAVRLDKAGVHVETHRGAGEVGPSITRPIRERLEALRKGLQGRYEFVAGLALPHWSLSTKDMKKHE
jgi:hypothetical protein